MATVTSVAIATSVAGSVIGSVTGIATTSAVGGAPVSGILALNAWASSPSSYELIDAVREGLPEL